ncbi:MAG: DUF3800 domain-containing protein [Candidatus Komeilibacteria bacterium]|nr:DUF3800 domain-containing protein [Candidatus Komeilibacteria bacterium]
MLQAFIDESGDLGHNEGYFIISMIIAHNPKRIKNIIKKFCAYHSLPEAHASDLNFPKKQFLISTLTKQPDYSVSYIIADKMMIKEKRLFESNNLLFNYLFSFLVKDVIKANTDDIHFYLDNRTQKVASANSLKEYISIKAYTEWSFNKNLFLEYKDSKDCKALQMADLVANCIRRKYQRQISDFYSCLNIAKSIKFPYQAFRSSLSNPQP